MHSLLETYLSEVAAHLSAMPAKQCAEEMREVRAHLENAVTVNRERGQSEDEATQDALAQFGTPGVVGHETVTVWRRGETLSRRSLWGAALCTLAVWFLVPLLLSLLEKPYSDPVTPAQVRAMTAAFPWLLFCSQVAAPLFAGAMSGLLFLKRVMAGTALGAALYTILCQGLFLYWINSIGHIPPGQSVSMAAFGLAAQSVEGGLIVLLGAWAGSRARLTRKKWGRPARS